MLNRQSEQKFFENLDAAEASAARAFIGEDGPDPDDLDEEGTKLWEQYQAENAWPGVCPCGVEGCKGLDWLLDGEEPY